MRTGRLRGTAVFISCLVLASSLVGADPSDEFSTSEGRSSGTAGDEPPPLPPPEVALDTLLKLPSGWGESDERRQGMTASQWRARFADLRQERERAEEAIAQARRELDSMAEESGGGSWNMGAPGSNNTEVGPMSFKHREVIRSGKEQLDELRRRKRALEIEADIAGVPESWRAPEAAHTP